MLPFGLIDILPASTALHIGPISIDFYGIGYAIALAVGVWIASRQAILRRENPDHIGNGIIPVFVLGLIGARVYHLIDQWNTLYAQDPIKAILPPYTGLGIYGGIVGGIIGVVWYTRRHHLSFMRWADIAVPAVLVGQAIARWGNFFNQELYGPPTNLPWGIAIDCSKRVVEYSCSVYPPGTGFQPLFFYESSLDLIGAVVALWLSRRVADRLRDGDLFSFWFIWYGARSLRARDVPPRVRLDVLRDPHGDPRGRGGDGDGRPDDLLAPPRPGQVHGGEGPRARGRVGFGHAGRGVRRGRRAHAGLRWTSTSRSSTSSAKRRWCA